VAEIRYAGRLTTDAAGLDIRVERISAIAEVKQIPLGAIG
jgi:hypothetical protein